MQNSYKKLGQILFRKIFIGYALIAILFTGYHIFAQYNLAKENTIKDMKAIEQDFYSALSNSIWHFDEEQIKAGAEAISASSGIIGISIISANDEVFIQKGILALKDNRYSEFIFEKNDLIKFSDKLIEHSFDVYAQEGDISELLAKVSIYTSIEAIYEIVEKSLYFILIYSVVIIVSLWILFTYFAQKLLTKPLSYIIQATKEFDVSEEYKEISLDDNSKYGELNILVNKFNNMSQRNNEAYEKLKNLALLQEQQKQELIVANKAKDDFLANVSHELKTPLNSINLLSATMMKNRQGDLDEKYVKSLNIINSCGHDLLSLINDILDISKLEAGRLEADFDMCDIQNIFKDMVEMFNPQIKQKGLNFIYSCDASLAQIYSDEKRIKQVIKNLLSNAVKFTSSGSIKFIIQDMGEYINILIEDDGIGISQEKQKHIFDRFKQADASTTRKYGGTGLGLAISKELVELLKGEISLESYTNQGCKFTLRIPKNAKNINIQNKQTTSEKIIENNHQEDKNQENILILNTNPSLFFKLIVDIKKQHNLTQIQSIEEFKDIYEKHSFKYLIIDIDSLKDSSILDQFDKSKMILLYEDKLELSLEFDVLLTIKKPIDGNILEYLNKI